MNNPVINYFCGNKLSFATHDYGSTPCFVGWGNKPNTIKVQSAAAQKKIPYFRLEDGFIRSLGLGVQGFASFSIVKDDLGIYYDATKPSQLEKILAEHGFSDDIQLEEKAEHAINLIRRFKISKYNATTDLPDSDITDNEREKILVIAQTAGDMSLEYGFGNQFSTGQIIDAAIHENPGADVYLKIHPDVIAGKKKSDLDPKQVPAGCRVISRHVNPISLLEKFDKVYTKTSQMGFEAILLGKECVCFGLPFYAGWGLTDDRVSCSRRKRKLTLNQIFAGAYIIYSRYYNPYLNKETDVIDTLYTIKKYRDIAIVNSSNLLVHGLAHWKRIHYRHFFKSYQRNSLTFCSSVDKIKALSKKKKVKLFIWGKSEKPDLAGNIDTTLIDTYSVENGLLQALALGAERNKPYSLVVDSRGIYLDPSSESDLEHIYNTYDFKSHIGLLDRAEKIIDSIVSGKLSKCICAPQLNLEIDRDTYDKIILVPGQIADGASIRLGGLGMTNSSLIEQIRKNNPASYIVFKPHPDVVADNRQGHLKEDYVLTYCDQIVSDLCIDMCICAIDEVHTITSLSGFKAILHNKKVVTYGLPFYANWGLTEDLHTCERRKRSLSKEELVAGALLLYPRYIHPVSREFCEMELILEGITRAGDCGRRPASCRQANKKRNQTISASKNTIRRFK